MQACARRLVGQQSYTVASLGPARAGQSCSSLTGPVHRHFAQLGGTPRGLSILLRHTAHVPPGAGGDLAPGSVSETSAQEGSAQHRTSAQGDYGRRPQLSRTRGVRHRPSGARPAAPLHSRERANCGKPGVQRQHKAAGDALARASPGAVRSRGGYNGSAEEREHHIRRGSIFFGPRATLN